MKTKKIYPLLVIIVLLFFAATVERIAVEEHVSIVPEEMELIPGERDFQIIADNSANDKVLQAKPATINASEFPTLQAAFDAVPESGGEVIIPPGTYELFKPLVLSSEDTHVKGAGTSTHLINLNENGEPAVVIRPKNISDLKTYIWRIHLSDFRVSGNNKSGDGLFFERVNELHLSGLMVDHNGGHGINITRCPENPRINHCNITYNAKAGMYVISCDDVVISANQFEENQDALQFINGFNLSMSGNNIDDHLRYGIVIENTYGSFISSNMIEECNSTAIILDRDCYGITVSANVIADDGSGVELRDAWGCTVSANTFVMVFNFSVLAGPNSGRITITGNNFCNSYIGEGKIKRVEQGINNEPMRLGRDGGTGIILQGTSDIAVSGNVFGGLSGEAVKADETCKRILVTGNTMTDLGRRATGARAAIDLGGAKESIVKDNAVGEGLILR